MTYGETLRCRDRGFCPHTHENCRPCLEPDTVPKYSERMLKEVCYELGLSFKDGISTIGRVYNGK